MCWKNFLTQHGLQLQECHSPDILHTSATASQLSQHPRIKTFVIVCRIQMQKGKKWGPSPGKPALKPRSTVTMVLQKDKRGRWQVGRMEGSDVKQTVWWTHRELIFGKGLKKERTVLACTFLLSIHWELHYVLYIKKREYEMEQTGDWKNKKETQKDRYIIVTKQRYTLKQTSARWSTCLISCESISQIAYQ